MSSKQLDKLGALLIEQVRDGVIDQWDAMIEGRLEGATANHVRSELMANSNDSAKILRQFLPRIVDASLHEFLQMIEEEQKYLQLLVSVEEYEAVDVVAESDGLSGELYGDQGWIARFSKERHDEF